MHQKHFTFSLAHPVSQSIFQFILETIYREPKKKWFQIQNVKTNAQFKNKRNRFQIQNLSSHEMREYANRSLISLVQMICCVSLIKLTYESEIPVSLNTQKLN